MSKAVSGLTKRVTQDLQAILQGPADPARLEAALRLLAKWRSHLIENTLVKRDGSLVQGGPFKGMDYSIAATEGARAARLLGCYEATLIPVIEEIVSRNYPQIIDIGSAEGYYAVGFARRMADTIVHARDSDAAARQRCAELAARNGVAERLRIGGEITHSELDDLIAGPTLVLCDIEGGEAQLLDPAACPALIGADILVETHPGLQSAVTETLTARFSRTHEIAVLNRNVQADALPGWAEELTDLDRLLMLWEWRSAPTPWLWMQARG